MPPTNQPTPNQIASSHNQLLANFQQHSHTGADSPRVNYDNLSNVPKPLYVGSIDDSGNFNLPANPAPWSITNPNAGAYTITHNLGTSAYIVMLSGWDSIGTKPYIELWVSGALRNNSFDVVTASVGTQTNTGFFFIVTPLPNGV